MFEKFYSRYQNMVSSRTEALFTHQITLIDVSEWLRKEENQGKTAHELAEELSNIVNKQSSGR